jgi:UDP-N-acetylmuramoyl-L-alanyl-D-glutamate--2,6-diaminopimelate ligase
MGGIAAKIADFTIITSDNPRSEDPDKIIEEIYGGIALELKHKVVNIANRAEAIAYAVSFSKANDILLISGKGHEQYQIIGNERIHFNDAEEINKNNI